MIRGQQKLSNAQERDGTESKANKVAFLISHLPDLFVHTQI